MSGHLDLVFSSHPDRGTWLASQAFAAPMHLSKTYWDGETLLVNVVNQTAGIFGGDTITTRVVVESGARVLLASPSAARFHPSHGRESRLEQSFTVRSGGCLDVFPEISIPQRDSSSMQKTVIEIEPGGELIYLETLAPGRVASGEVFAFARYGWQTDIRLGDRMVHRERACVRPNDASCAGLRALFPVSYYVGMVVISPLAEKWDAEFQRDVLRKADERCVRIAASRLNDGGWSIRILAVDSLALRERVRQLRVLIYERLGRKLPDLRRAG